MPDFSPKPSAASLVEAFREDVADAIASLEAQCAILARHEVANEHTQAAGREVFRVVHGLRGAARAVGRRNAERACDALETQLAGARHGELDDMAELRSIADRALTLVRNLDSTGPAKSRPPPSSMAAPPAAAQHDVSFRIAEQSVQTLKRCAQSLVATVLSASDMRPRPRDDLRNLTAILTDLSRHVEEPEGQKAVTSALQLTGRLVSSQRETWGTWAEALTRIQRVATDVHESVQHLSLAPLDALAAATERTAFEVARQNHKRVRVETKLSGVLVDVVIRDSLREVLIHLVTNAVDHGIEDAEQRAKSGKSLEGMVVVEAWKRGDELCIEVRDDGRGVDPVQVEAAAERLGADAPGSGQGDPLALIFTAGLSTAASTAVASGRGIGLDAVASRMARLRGRIEVESVPERGTTIRLLLPTQLSSHMVVVVRCGSGTYALDVSAVETTFLLKGAATSVLDGCVYVSHGVDLVPLVHLSTLLRSPPAVGPTPSFVCVVVSRGDTRIALRVDEVSSVERVVFQPVTPRAHSLIAGAAARPTGEALVLLDERVVLEQGHATPYVAEKPVTRSRAHILVVDDALTTRQLMRAILESAGYRVSVAGNGASAWEMLTSDAEFHLVVTDIDMPRMDGFALLQSIRATPSTAELPVILVTGIEGANERRRARSLRASAYISKSSFDHSELKTAIEGLL